MSKLDQACAMWAEYNERCDALRHRTCTGTDTPHGPEPANETELVRYLRMCSAEAKRLKRNAETAEIPVEVIREARALVLGASL